MNITTILTTLKEELKDIPANPDNLHYTDFKGLYGILKYGLMGRRGGYYTKSSSTGKSDMELSTVRNSHKLSRDEKAKLSSKAAGGVRIGLFTDRILSAHRGTRKTPIAEIPLQTINYLKGMERTFKQTYGFNIPKLFNQQGYNFQWEKGHKKGEDINAAREWVSNNHPELSPDKAEDVAITIVLYNRGYLGYNNEAKNREREERFLLKSSIPVKPEFMNIAIEIPVKDMIQQDRTFCRRSADEYLNLMNNNLDVFEGNNNLRQFMELLRKYKEKSDAERR